MHNRTDTFDDWLPRLQEAVSTTLCMSSTRVYDVCLSYGSLYTTGCLLRVLVSASAVGCGVCFARRLTVWTLQRRGSHTVSCLPALALFDSVLANVYKFGVNLPTDVHAPLPGVG